ncbi:ATP-binding protein [Prevotella sp.]|uniref:ATP-binding protein n=1 Tax=uncultured Prevotella sp. TaxID=159272 RepID=UPI0027E32B34|nr:ATP-binding protein [Prevotella sp.]
MDENIESVKRYNLWFDNTIDCGFPRPLYTANINQYLGNKVVKVLTGQRRVGKSYILRQTAMHLMRQGVSGNNIVFINRELTAFDFIENYKDLDNFIRLYRQELKPEGRIYIFIDEVQDIEGWERVVNSLSQDFTEDYELFITGSNSKMFSGELSTLLSGRYVEFHIFPLSYEEYASVHQLPIGKQSYMQYMADGGYPELVHFQSSDVKRNYISGLKDTVLLKDIIRRYTIRDIRLLEDLFAYLVNNSSNLLSITNITNFIKSKGRKTSYDTVSAYLGYIEEVYLAHRALRYNIKGKETLSGSYKYYMNDLSFKNYLYAGFGYGTGYLLENLVYLELLRHGYDVYVGSIKEKEVDFVAIKNDRTIYVQATYLLIDEHTIEREYAPLELIADNYEKVVVSLDDLQMPSRNGIKHIRAWELSQML